MSESDNKAAVPVDTPRNDQANVQRESNRIKIFRRIFYWAVPIAYVAYVVYLIYSLATDSYSLNSEHNFLNEIDVPDILICGTNDLIISRCDFVWKDSGGNSSKTQLNGCGEYILPGTLNLGGRLSSCRTFSTNQTLKYAHPYEPVSGLTRLGIYLQIPNVTAAEQGNIGIASLNVVLLPPGFNPLANPDQVVDEMDKDVKSEMQLQWDFIAGMVNYVALVKFKISEYKAILPDDASAIMGFGPKYHITPKIQNSVTYFPFNQNPYNVPAGSNVYFSVAAGSFVQEGQSEERTITVLDALAAAGGAFGIIGGAYVLFFGQDRIEAFGYAHKFADSDSIVGASFFRTDCHAEKHDSANSLDAQVLQLHSDVNTIKDVLRCYVLDTSYLEEGPQWFADTRAKISLVCQKLCSCCRRRNNQ
ncbi:6214_t:CDS:2 [Paraglomus brasilianum]|uniref:6214_t:CDS:1 n=1 Tax=Paraglomus brasilianum TaxID=144538 RepID=A0A9N9BDJ7_9GLOM|nr:6214_t:CDS:2 [Paraglomus brasilianum]